MADVEQGTTYQPGYGAVPTFADSVPPPYDADAMKKPLNDATPQIRLAFIRKVYSILSAQLGLTTIVTALFMYSPAVKYFVQDNVALIFVSWFFSLATLIALIAYRRSAPTNMYLLMAFTAAEAYTVGTVCTFYDSMIVMQATILTFVLFIGLTVFTVQSKFNFEGMGPFLFGSLWVIIFASFMHIFLPFSSTYDLVIAIATAIVFCGYIVFDTFMLFNRFTPEDYIVASVELYLDILNLFLSILRILGNNRD